ncbi:tRNA (adenosine(37)-N6)-threonylcarbamoyltransferase complex transferase subunit TsaD [Patescibacteria group bacterium]
MKILAIESSCDETSCALVENGALVLSEIVSSSADLHMKTGGVVPEVAARKQVESIVPVIDECLSKANISDPEKEIDCIAVTVGPGLIGSLLVGVEAAKTLALSWGKPLIPVNHLIGHIYSNFVGNENQDEIIFPAIVLIVSGGHTDLVLMHDHGKFTFLGGTVDDAAGEAFDKVARMLGFSSYLGGAELSKSAASCTNNYLLGSLPRPMIDTQDYNFSFSGLKTAVKTLYAREKPEVSVLSCEFETAVVDVLVKKTMKAAVEYNVATVMLGGGVSANRHLRQRMHFEAEALGIKVFIPPINLCGDTASYIASAAFYNNSPKSLKDIVANPSLGIMDVV